MRAVHVDYKLVAIALIAVATNASAELTLRLEPEAEDPGTSSMPARFGQAKSGKGSGAATQFAISYSDRTRITFAGAYARDQSVSGDRVKDDYKKGKAQAQYAFYDVANPPKGKTLFSLVFERSIGREALSTSTNKKASTGLYLGVRL